MDLVTVQDVMERMELGPNGALIYAMEFLFANVDWLVRKLRSLSARYFIFDCPGQVELYTHHDVFKKIIERLEKEGFRLCVVQLIDSHYCNDPGKFIATLVMALSTMLQLGMPHINVLSKIDLAKRNSDKLHFALDFYTDVLDLNYLLDALKEDPFTKKYARLNEAIVGLVEDFSLVTFLPLCASNKKSLLEVRAAADKANGYVFGTGEQRNVSALLSCAMGVTRKDEETDFQTDEVNESDALLWN